MISVDFELDVVLPLVVYGDPLDQGLVSVGL